MPEDQVEEPVEEIITLDGTEEDEEVSEEEIEEDDPEPPVNQAQALVDLLNNPTTAKATLQFIASNLGLTVSEAKTLEGQVAIKDVIKQALGEDLAFLGDKLGPLGDAIERIINDRIGKAEVKINERHQQQEAARFQESINSAMQIIDKETKGEFNSLMPRINKLMEEMPLGKQSPEQYLKRLYNTAKSEAEGSVKKSSTNKVENARREALKTSTNGTGNPERVKEGSSSNPTYREAISAAIRESSRK